MQQVAVIGCGVIGAAIAYELSQVPGLQVVVFDRHLPAQASTGAALGVLMGAISQKTKGKAWALRQASLQRYETLIPELEAATGHPIPYNRQGIVLLCFAADEAPRWQSLIELRQAQGWYLEQWQPDQLQAHCPQVQHPEVVSAIYSKQDRQVEPTALTLALVEAARRNGVDFRFGTEICGLQRSPAGNGQICSLISTTSEAFAVDWVVLAAGLGTTALARTAQQPVEIRPVLGQALRVRLEQPLGNPNFQPVITGQDIHIVPLGGAEYWVGATVEFPTEAGTVLPASADRLAEVWQGAIALCPALQQATVLQTWSGLRPRPYNRPAPVIERLAGYHNVLLATGHYRNGVLLAPATAQQVRSAIVD